MPPKKQKNEDIQEEAVVENDSSDSDLSDEASDEEIQTDFDAFPPSSADYHGIKQLLNQLLAKSTVNAGEFSEIIIEQENVAEDDKSESEENGNSEAEDDDGEVIFGVVTVVDMCQDKECITQLKDYLMALFDNSKTEKKVQSFNLFDDTKRRIGWFINERFLNIPHHISLPSFQSLLDDLDNGGFVYDKFFAVLKIHKIRSPTEANTGNSAGKKRTAQERDCELSVFYANAEEEFLFEESQWLFDCPTGEIASMGDDNTSFNAFRRVISFDRDAFNKAVERIKADVDSSVKI